ncbi:MAG: penicillin-binding protein 1A [Burkholderiales bacterium]|nr:penicillin-binding protein 1A [Burkholderiales bacterium]
MTFFRWIAFPVALVAGLATVGLALAAFVLLLAYPNLPSIEAVTDYRPRIPLRVYTADGALIGEFGEERRSVVAIQDVPKPLKDAILAAEDERFYQHQGVDFIGVMRAAYSNLVSGGRRQGASTITMQVARNFFLSSEKTLTRKLYEALLAYKIESELTKDQILDLYVNQIYLGQRAYGFAAASQIYFGKPISQLTVAEAAMLAGLPKAPSAYNPVASPRRAKQRQQYVLRRMRELDMITEAQYDEALKAPLAVRREIDDFAVHGEFVAEMVRQALFDRYGPDVYSLGFRVYTTVRKADQEAAYAALRRGVLDYDRRHGYRGPEGFADLPAKPAEEALEEALADFADSDDLVPAIVLSASPKQVVAYRRGGETLTIGEGGLKFVQSALSEKAAPARRIRPGAIVRVQRDEKGNLSIAQLPEAEAALVAMSPVDGAIRALVGGFDFGRNKFNHVTQAWRQPGSSFKPFIYSAALERGFTPATILLDEPIVVDAAQTGSQTWEPKNYDGKYEGPMRLRTALAKSKNMVSIRILQSIGPRSAQEYVTRFGFEADKHPAYLTMALGAGSVTPLQMARAYGVFANGGYLVEPYIIERIVDDRGTVLAQANPKQAGDPALRVLDPRNAFLMTSMMQDVTRYGTAARANALGRRDIAGKTGTTNEHVDAWFAGYQPTLVAVAWIGFDQPRNLGANETGGAAALPMWIAYMGKVLQGVPQMEAPVPEGVISVRIDPDTGLASPDGKQPEFFYREHPPQEAPPAAAAQAEAKPAIPQ